MMNQNWEFELRVIFGLPCMSLSRFFATFSNKIYVELSAEISSEQVHIWAIPYLFLNSMGPKIKIR